MEHDNEYHMIMEWRSVNGRRGTSIMGAAVSLGKMKCKFTKPVISDIGGVVGAPVVPRPVIPYSFFKISFLSFLKCYISQPGGVCIVVVASL